MTGPTVPAGPAPPPRLVPAAPQQSWLELFYDLAFVAAIVVMSTTYSSNAGLEGVIWLALVFSLIWCTWLTTTLLLGVGLVTTMWTRSLLLVQMVLVLGVAITSDYAHEDHSAAVGPIFAAVLVTLALFFRAARRSSEELDTAYKGYGLRCILAAGVFVITPAVGWPWWYPLVWVGGILLFMVPTGSAERRLRMDSHHMVHRFGEFTIIMLGEVFVKLGLTASHEPLDAIDMFGLPLATAVVFGIWWLYFTDVPELGMAEKHSRRLTWVYLHFPLHLGVVAAAVALAHTLLPESEGAGHDGPTASTIRYIVIPVAVILVTIGMIGLYSGGPRTLTAARLRIFLYAAAALIVTEVALLGTDSYDLEASAVIVIVVLAFTAARIRRLGAPAEVTEPPTADPARS